MLRRFSLTDLKLVDAPPEAAFDNLTELAAAMLAAPVSLVSIIDPESDRQFFKSQRGVAEPWASARQTPLSHSFCQHVVKADAPLVVGNAPEHPVVRDNLAIADLGVIAYLGVPVHDPSGIPVGALCVIEGAARQWSRAEVDKLSNLAKCVTDAIRLNAAVLDSEALRTEQREFTYAISHELKSPVNTMQLLLNELSVLYPNASGGDGRELLDHGLETARRMSRLVDDVLNYTRIVGQELQRETVEVTALISEILDDLKANIGAVGAEVILRDLPVVSGNPMQLRMLFQNLISNAIKYCRPEVAPVVTITGARGAGTAPTRIVVADNGIGISTAHHEKVFKLFQRLHVRDEYPGTGVGLALCQRIAFNHGGHIDLVSEASRGAAFTVYLPGE